MEINAKELFERTQAWADQNGYRERKQRVRDSDKYSARAQRIVRLLNADGGADSFGCRKSLVYKLVELVLGDDEPLPPLDNSKASSRKREIWNDDADFTGTEAQGHSIATVPVWNIEGHTYPLGRPILIDDETTVEDENEVTNCIGVDSIRREGSIYIYEMRPATYEECRQLAWALRDRGPVPDDFQPAEQPAA